MVRQRLGLSQPGTAGTAASCELTARMVVSCDSRTVAAVMLVPGWRAVTRTTVTAGGAGRQPWDIMRFLKTVAYFNELPSPDKLAKDVSNMFRQLGPQAQVRALALLALADSPVVSLDLPLSADAAAAAPLQVPVNGIIMVTGATGGVGRRVVARLLAAGKHVRALVRDVDKAKAMLSELPVAPGGKLELAAGDVVQRQTLLPEMFERYKFIIRPDANWDGIAYCNSFDTVPGVWQTVRLPFADFFPVFRARRLAPGQPGAKPLDPAAVSSIQIMLSKFEYDGQLNPAFRRGPFRLPFALISSYLAEPVTPRFVHVSSAGVTRPNRPGINVDMEPPAVKLNDALGGILTWKLAGEDALRSSGVPYSILRPTALTEEPGGMPLELDQGDTIKGKISREDVADLCVALLGCPAATDTSFEVKSTVPFSQPWTLDAQRAAPARDWGVTLAGARLRPGVTGRTVDGVYTGRRTEEQALQEAGVTSAQPAATAAV
ncbi:hypothetical protein TSOC_005030 [Tetrabaena socialis]|uniref:NAD(P)-binding domain-containing protein n=1 Tax=Tetrabaena socialis TaxID=47790 RepID=A0A2J8A7A3_9CHLO|nr:hypothetical protein TSOC_005030 [Tetrabaena socialis]|eukprot:PNH08398.1 hypothetical protein TSOC_005030 [Tetrabaena socialis]